MNNWNFCKLKNITKKIGSGATPRGGGDTYIEEGISLIRSQNIYDMSFSVAGLAHISEEQAYELRNVSLEPNDVLLNITGDSVARCCIVPDFILPARVNQHVAIIRADLNKAVPKFIQYSLCLNKENLLMMSEIGATRKALTKGMIEDFEILIPPISEQQAIAEVLSSLDDKIDLLHRNNKTLEEMAETLFRQWFVEGVKEDWVTYRLDDISEHIKKSINPQKTEVTHFNHYSLPAFDNGKKPEYVDALSVLSNKYLVQTNDILISKLNPRTPRVWMIGKNQEESVCSTEFQVYRAKENEYKNIIYCFLKTQYVCDVLSGAASGTSGSHQRVNPEDISSLEIALPLNEAIIQKFHSITESIFIKVENNLKNISVLEKTRDTLLPKLMSGQVRVIS